MNRLFGAGLRDVGTTLACLILTGTGTAFGQLLYVPNLTGNNVSEFTVIPGTGALSPVPGQPTATNNGPTVTLMSPDSRFLFVGDQGGFVDGYVVGSNGSLTAVPPPVAAAGNVQGLAIDSTGKFLYASNGAGTSINEFSINQLTGALTAIGTFPLPALSSPKGLATDGSGHLFVALSGANSIAQLSINAGTGALTQIAAPVSTGGTDPVQLVVSPTGTVLYVCDFASGDISILSIGGGGALALAGVAPVEALPQGLAVTPNGQFLITTSSTASSNNVLVFAISGLTLTSAGPAVSAGSLPVGVAVDPTGNFVYVSNSGSSNVSAFRLTGGTLTFLGNVATGAGPYYLTSRAAPVISTVPTLSSWSLLLLGTLLAGSSILLYKKAYR